MLMASPQDLGLWDPFQMAMKMAYKWGALGPNYLLGGMILQVGGASTDFFWSFFKR